MLDYYQGKDDRYFIVFADGDIHEDARGTRISCTRLTPLKELTRDKLILHGINFMIEHPHRERASCIDSDKGNAMNGFAVVMGENPIARGDKGDILYLIQTNKAGDILNVRYYQVDGEVIKEHEYYNIYGRDIPWTSANSGNWE